MFKIFGTEVVQKRATEVDLVVVHGKSRVPTERTEVIRGYCGVWTRPRLQPYVCGKMAAVGRGSLRPYQPSKAHCYLVLGLLAVVLVLSYNYWLVNDTKNRQTYDISALQASLQKLRYADSLLKVGY